MKERLTSKEIIKNKENIALENAPKGENIERASKSKFIAHHLELLGLWTLSKVWNSK
jgi:hypothetical protein